MKGLDLYKWIAGSMNDFAKPFRENEALYNQARSFWRHLESASAIIIAIFVVLGIAFAVWYYTAYNNKPGRHYHPKHWLIFLACVFGATFLLTWGFEFIAVKPTLDGATMVQLKIALGNAIYASGLYFFMSLIWCNFLPTNACRIFKI